MLWRFFYFKNEVYLVKVTFRVKFSVFSPPEGHFNVQHFLLYDFEFLQCLNLLTIHGEEYLEIYDVSTSEK